jgi:polar amino acid transport system substrate-binding protein
MDLDDFKPVNDTRTQWVTGFCRIVSERMLSSVRDTDTVARVRGDEFIALFPGSPTSASSLPRPSRSPSASLNRSSSKARL